MKFSIDFLVRRGTCTGSSEDAFGETAEGEGEETFRLGALVAARDAHIARSDLVFVKFFHAPGRTPNVRSMVCLLRLLSIFFASAVIVGYAGKSPKMLALPFMARARLPLFENSIRFKSNNNFSDADDSHLLNGYFPSAACDMQQIKVTKRSQSMDIEHSVADKFQEPVFSELGKREKLCSG